MSEKNNMSRAQQIYDRFRGRASRDDEFGDWAEYREELTAYVLAHTSPGSDLLILGAGKCNDLDLGQLADHCGRITLSDYRRETAEEAFRRYGLTDGEKLDFLAADYAGITEADYLAYADQLLALMQRLAQPQEKATEQAQEGTLEEIAGDQLAALQETLEDIYQRNEGYEIDLGEQAYDNAVICGVHSQLNNSFRGIFQYVRRDVEDRMGQVRYADELNTAIFQITRAHTGQMVERFNRAAFAAVREGIIYGYEDHILFTPAGSDGPVRGTVDGARQAGEAIEGIAVRDRQETVWPLSRRRRIEFEMILCYVPAEDRRLQFIRTQTLAQRAGAYYVRIQGMAVKHHITLEAEFDEHDTPDAKYIVALDDVLPVATARLYPISEEAMMLGRIVVLPEYRHRGLGSQVVTEAERWARELGYHKAVLESRDNKLPFYVQLGYRADPDRVIHGDTFTCIYMEKDL